MTDCICFEKWEITASIQRDESGDSGMCIRKQPHIKQATIFGHTWTVELRKKAAGEKTLAKRGPKRKRTITED